VDSPRSQAHWRESLRLPASGGACAGWSRPDRARGT